MPSPVCMPHAFLSGVYGEASMNDDAILSTSSKQVIRLGETRLEPSSISMCHKAPAQERNKQLVASILFRMDLIMGVMVYTPSRQVPPGTWRPCTSPLRKQSAQIHSKGDPHSTHLHMGSSIREFLTFSLSRY